MSNATRKRVPAKPAPKAPTGVDAYLDMAEEGVLWTAPSGAVIRIRDLSIIDRALTDSLPNHLQDVVNGILDKSESLSEDDAERSDLETALDMLGGERKSLRSTLDNLYELGNALCIAAWIEPEVVPTAADVQDPARQLPADRIMRDDRLAFVGRILGMNAGESQQLATFPGKQG